MCADHQGGFNLPPGVSYHKESLAGGMAYVFRHQDVGLLGRIVLQEVLGSTQLSLELAGDPDDPMTAQRAEMFKPLSMDLADRLESQLGTINPGPTFTSPFSPPPSHELVESKMIQCERCDAGVALLIFADQATDRGGLEDYACKMYAQVRQMDLPTYVIGPPVGDEPLPERPADIMKIWPERGQVQQLRPNEFNPIVDVLIRSHCRKGLI